MKVQNKKLDQSPVGFSDEAQHQANEQHFKLEQNEFSVVGIYCQVMTQSNQLAAHAFVNSAADKDHRDIFLNSCFRVICSGRAHTKVQEINFKPIN